MVRTTPNFKHFDQKKKANKQTNVFFFYITIFDKELTANFEDVSAAKLLFNAKLLI